jgi:alcohol dehydrogenase class IV
MARINYITRIEFDFGAVKLLQQKCERVGKRHPLVVSDAGVLDKGAEILRND